MKKRQYTALEKKWLHETLDTLIDCGFDIVVAGKMHKGGFGYICIGYKQTLYSLFKKLLGLVYSKKLITRYHYGRYYLE